MIFKILKSFIAASLVVSLGVFSSLDVTEASQVETEMSVEESEELAILFSEHLQSDGDYYLSLINEEDLKQKLESSSLNFEIEDFKLYIEDFNSKLSGDQGKEVQEELLVSLENFERTLEPEESGMVTTSSAGKTVCSAAMSAAGISNSTIIGAGSLALGLSGPAGWTALGAAAATSVMWTGGSLVACR